MISEYRPTERIVRGRDPRLPPLGFYAFGGCDLSPILRCAPRIADAYPGPFAIRHERLYSGSRTDVILQGLRQIPLPQVVPLTERFGVPIDYFRTRVFEPAFVPAKSAGSFYPKSVVALSLAADIRRPLYRHKKHRFLSDPGSWWFGHEMAEVLRDADAARWYWENFEPVGRLSPERAMANLSRIVALVRRVPGTVVVVLNGRRVADDPCEERRVEINRRVAELARAERFAVLDFDSLLAGVTRSGVDAPTPPGWLAGPVSERLFELIRASGVLSRRSR